MKIINDGKEYFVQEIAKLKRYAKTPEFWSIQRYRGITHFCSLIRFLINMLLSMVVAIFLKTVFINAGGVEEGVVVGISLLCIIPVFRAANYVFLQMVEIEGEGFMCAIILLIQTGIIAMASISICTTTIVITDAEIEKGLKIFGIIILLYILLRMERRTMERKLIGNIVFSYDGGGPEIRISERFQELLILEKASVTYFPADKLEIPIKTEVRIRFIYSAMYLDVGNYVVPKLKAVEGKEKIR